MIHSNKAIANIDRIVGYLDYMNDAGNLPDHVYEDCVANLFSVRSTIELDFKSFKDLNK